MGRNVLVVSTADHPEQALRDQLGDVEQVKVVVPAIRQGVLDWLANDERAFSAAQEQAERTATALPGETVDARAGEADIELAIRDALATFPADEIVVALPSGGELDERASEQVSRAANGIPVRRVVVAS